MNQRKRQLFIVQPEETLSSSNTHSKTPNTTHSKQEKLTKTMYSITPRPRNRDNYASNNFQTARKFLYTKRATDSPQKSDLSSKSHDKVRLPYFGVTITQKEALQKVEELQQWGTQHTIRLTVMQVKAKQQERKTLKEKPDISMGSQEIYREVKQKKHLRDNILERFGQYEQEKVQHRLDKMIMTHFEQTRTIPTIRSLLRSHRDQLVRLLRNCSKHDSVMRK